MLSLFLAGTSYKNCALDAREQLAPSASEIAGCLDGLCHLAREAVVLSTCHRLEIYAVPQSTFHRPQQLLEAISTSVALSDCYFAQGEEAVRHLFKVSAGLDSAVTGESQILRQVKQAHEIALEHGCSGALLSSLFRHAIATGKRARASGLKSNYASLGAAAVALAGKVMGKLQGKNALIIGAGKVGELAGQALIKQGAGSITVTSRTFARAQELANRLGAQAISFKELSRSLACSHLVLTATTAPHWIVPRRTVAAAMKGREEPLVILDLAVPRDVEPSASSVPGVKLYNVDDLVQHLGLSSPDNSQGVALAESAVAEGIDRFSTWLLERQAAPTISAIYDRADQVSTAEFNRARRTLGEISVQEWDTLHHLARAINRKLLHTTAVRLRAEAASGNGHEFNKLVRELFGV